MIPPAVVEARAKQLPHHRTPQFRDLITTSHEKLKKLFCTQNDIYSITASGSGAMEAVVSSLLSPGDTAICVDGGKFGHRWIELCRCYQINVVPLTIERGNAVESSLIEKTLKDHPEAKAVFLQLTETSTGVTYDIKAIGTVVAKTKAVLVVDAISGLGAEEFWPDTWHVDVVISGSQKALMLPPGLGFVSLSQKAWAIAEKAKNSTYYFDLKRYRKGHETGEHPFTPAISLYIELGEVVKMIEEETIQGVWKRHAWLAKATRAGVAALGLELFAKRPCNVLTAVHTPSGIDASKLIGLMRDDLGVTVTGGQDELKGKIIRIAHLGYVDRFDILAAISALEIGLKRLGFLSSLGKGITAAETVLAENP